MCCFKLSYGNVFFFSLIELVDRKFILELLVFNNAANALDLGVDHQIIDGGGRGGGGGGGGGSKVEKSPRKTRRF